MTMVQMGSSLDQENKIGIMGFVHHHHHHVHDHEHDDDDDSFSSDVSSVVSSDNESDDAFEDLDSSNDDNPRMNEQTLDMSDLLQQLPFKRGLSKHYQGKSQSFTSLSKVVCLEDLAKPENPYNKKLKSCQSYVGLSRLLPPPTRSASSSRLFTKKTSARGSCSSVSNSSSSRPPTHPSHSHGAPNSSGFSNQTPLFV